AGKWKQYSYPNYLEDLKPYQVVLCPDRDEPGVKHCEEIEADLIDHGIPVAGWLYAFPDSYLWQRLPKSGGADVADWIADGATRDDILGAVEARRVAPVSPEPVTGPSIQLEEKHCSMRVQYHQIRNEVGDQLRYNLLTKGIELDGEALDVDDLQVKLAVENNIQAADNHFQKIVSSIAREKPFSPVVEYLDQVHQQHGHSTTILDNLAARYFGATHPLHDRYIRKTLIAAVARAYEHGCKVDTACILQGRQGANKSTFFKVLASDAWFDDSLGNASDKDERLKLHKVWFVEWAELETVFKRRDVATVKAFLSSSRDLIRPPYGREVKEFDRPSIIVGTTNEIEFLSDPTGSRRYWVVPVARKIDITQLAKERDAIWGAAVAAYRAGEQWWLSDDDQALSDELNQEYATQDPWANAVEAYLSELAGDEVTVDQILENCIHLDLDKQTKGAEMRIAGILKQGGWTKERRRAGGRRFMVWTRSEMKEISFFTERGVAGVATTAEPSKNQSFQAGHTLATPIDRGVAGVASQGTQCDGDVCQSSKVATPGHTSKTRCGQPQTFSEQGLEAKWPHRPHLDRRLKVDGAGFQVGDAVRKAGKTGWRGEIVRIVSPTHVDVKWTGEKHPQQMAIADLQLILDQAQSSPSLNGTHHNGHS
ncbi:hypothetical protein C7271_07570, partial [filamentous cyanobacterium CCP5]